jgi:WD40 repeat protein
MTDEHVLIGHENGHLQLIDPDTAQTIRHMNGHTGKIYCIVYCPELSMAITGSHDFTARVWNVATGECVHVLEGHDLYVTCAAVHGTTYVNCTLLIVDWFITSYSYNLRGTLDCSTIQTRHGQSG